MPRVQLIHWNKSEAQTCITALQSIGHEVGFSDLDGLGQIRLVRDRPPDVIAIDLSRVPSLGREVAMAIRRQKATRHVPLIFVGGERDKVVRVRQILPDAIFTTWLKIGPAIKRAIARNPSRPVVPDTFAAYAGRSLCDKLGIKCEMLVALVNAPTGFAKSVGQVPPDVRIIETPADVANLTIWFAPQQRDLKKGLKRIVSLAAIAPVWIAWPKKASGVATDLNEKLVRETGLNAGLVDYKICAINETWSGLLFRKRRSA